MRNFKLWLLLLLGTLSWSLTMVKSGLVTGFGMGFWGANGHDGIWHIALIEGLSRGSWQMPVLAGEQIKNYHLGFDLIAAGLHTLTRIPTVTLYFQILPPVFSILIGLLTYKLTKNLWSVFFVYFGGSWAWVIGRGESAFWSQQAVSTLINPPFALSLIFLLLLLLLLKKNNHIWAGLILALLPHVKIYAGLLAFGGLFVAGVKNKKYYLSLIIGLLIYFATNPQLITNNQQLIIWQPGWFLQTMMAVSDRLDWPRYYSALINYQLDGKWLKLTAAYIVAFLIFWFGNMGTRALKEIFILKKLKKPRLLASEDLFIWSIIIAGGVIPMFFLQTGTAWNTIQFFYYSLFFSSLIAGNSMDQILTKFKKNKILGFGICALVIALTLPTTLISLKDIYLPNRPPAAVSKPELEALAFLKKSPPGTVLTPLSKVDPYAGPPRSLYNYDSTAYVAALSGHPTYLEDEVNLSITGFDFRGRKKAIADYFSNPNSQESKNFIVQNNIRYIYMLDGPIWLYSPSFQNSQVRIYAVE